MAHRTLMALVFVLTAQTLASAESSFSTPAGAQSSSKGFSTPSGAETNGPFVSPSGFSTPAGSASSITVGGEVINIEGETYVLRDAQGRNLRIQPGKDARIDYTPRIGDNIEAQLNNGRASSITRAPATSGGSAGSGGGASAGTGAAGGSSSGGK
jgi:uncharacterized protein YdeI (BOF family)